MAPTDAVWSEQGTSPDAIEAALRHLLFDVHAQNEHMVPARVLNMIAFVDREWSGEIANRLRGVGRYHASRLLVLSYEPGRRELDAHVMIASDEQGGPDEIALLRETVVVDLGERHLDQLLTIADPLVVTDLPTLLWSPHGHHDVVGQLLRLAQAVLLDSVDEPDASEALERSWSLKDRAYVVDLAWLRSTPWRERIAASFDSPGRRPELAEITAVTIRHHPESMVSAMLLAGWLASRLGWRTEPLSEEGGALVGSADAGDRRVALRMEMAPDQQVRGLKGITLKSGSGRTLSLDRGEGGLRARSLQGGDSLEWTITGASRGEQGVLGEGIRQALLRDPTYVPALGAARAMAA